MVLNSACSFPRDKRLTTANDYRHVFASAKKLSVLGIKLLARKNNSESSRLGLIVAKRQFPLAVQRNRVKRLIRESFRQADVMQELGVDIIILAYKPLQQMTNEELTDKLSQLWKKLHHCQQK